MARVTMTVACAIGATLLASTTQAQQEINLTVAAGQALRALPPLTLLSEWWVPEVDRRVKAANLNIKINWRRPMPGRC